MPLCQVGPSETNHLWYGGYLKRIPFVIQDDDVDCQNRTIRIRDIFYIKFHSTKKINLDKIYKC